ncbi:MAG: DHH family phosphoesterase [Eubacterium sp.]|nr:DHH family phosphoesterase [Eubacterium sp.]
MSETSFEKSFAETVPLPICIVDSKGKVVSANSHIGEVFIYDDLVGSDFYALTGVRLSELLDGEEKKEQRTVQRSDKAFRLHAIHKNCEDGNTVVVFYDITDYETLKSAYMNERVCVAVVQIDNYDELIASTLPDMRMTITTQVDKTIRKWASDLKASIIHNKQNEYIVYFQSSFLPKLRENKFAILDEVRAIETESAFPMSLSIGVGIDGRTMEETEEFASSAIELALGRGGDQAVTKRNAQISYYGGKAQTVEKTNKGKSRVIARRLQQMIENSGRILIMGHKNPDMDCFGSALGIHRVCKMHGREASIVLDDVNESLNVVYKQAAESGKYSFISNEKALAYANSETLLIIVDTHRPSYLCCAELPGMVGQVAVIDHHRRAADAIENVNLSYIESYASSAAELVCEILQYSGKKRVLSKLEAEALLGGMTIDTNRFAVKTGVRTFEAAAWLRRSGADTTEVKRFFQTDLESFRARAEGIASAVVEENGIATSICKGNHREAQIINSQVADELLNIKGIKASFVASRNLIGQTVVSARSLGEINVQVIMEKLGGGGHLTTAGAQMDLPPEGVLEEIRKLVAAGIGQS